MRVSLLRLPWEKIQQSKNNLKSVNHSQMCHAHLSFALAILVVSIEFLNVVSGFDAEIG